MKYNPKLHHRRSIRLEGYDYSEENYYFVTVCTYNMKCILGEIVGREMILSEYGKIVERCWFGLPEHYPNVMLDEFVVMPNHVHGIINICRGGVFPPQTRGNDVNNKQTLTRKNNGYNNPNNIKSSNQINPSKKHGPRGGHMKGGKTPPLRKPTLGNIVGYYKYKSTTNINDKYNQNSRDIVKIWQRNYYEHIIRDDQALDNIRNYIRNNPLMWRRDRNNLW